MGDLVLARGLESPQEEAQGWALGLEVHCLRTGEPLGVLRAVHLLPSALLPSSGLAKGRVGVSRAPSLY